MKCSKASVQRLVKTALGVAPDLCVHQTLTFSPQVSDAAIAKAHLKKLLDNLHKQYQMGTIYVMEQHANQAWHIHALFLFFKAEGFPFPPSRMAKNFGKVVFNRWASQQNGMLVRMANRTRQYDRIEISYLLKGITIPAPGQKTPRSKFVWWGYQNKSLLKKHPRTVSRLETSTALASCLRLQEVEKSKESRPPYYSMAQLRKDKAWFEAYCDIAGGIDWESFKMRETGRKSPVSDEKYYNFMNGRDPFKKTSTDQTAPF